MLGGEPDFAEVPTMGIKDFLQGYNPDDQVYLTVVETSEGELPADKLRMLLCDAKIAARP